MNLNPKGYRLLLGRLRQHLGVLETLMSNQQFELIDFSTIPSVAMSKHKNSFSRKTNSKGIESDGRIKLCDSYQNYVSKLSRGDAKVNVTGLQPHELVSKYFGCDNVDPLIEAQWNTIKKGIQELNTFKNVTAIVDVSGSMNGTPMMVAIALGILVAECTTGCYHGEVITFHENPSWYKLHGNNLCEQVNILKNAPWGGSTNMKSVFDLILSKAIAAKLEPDEMVKTLFIFTDMQFDSCDRNNKWNTTFQQAKNNFESAGYAFPNIICWNLRTSVTKSLPVSQNEEGYSMLSGFSCELLKCLLNGEDITPLKSMLHILEPYSIDDNIINCTPSSIDELPFTDFVDKFRDAIKFISPKKSFKNNRICPISNRGHSLRGRYV